MIGLFVFNLFCCIFIVEVYGFSGFKATRWRVLKETWGIVMGNSPGEIMGFDGPDGFEYESIRGVFLFLMYVFAGVVLNVLISNRLLS